MIGLVLTLKAALNALHSVHPKWYDFGLLLEVPHYQLEIIEAERTIDDLQPLAETLEYWVINGTNIPATWRNLITMLEDAYQERDADQEGNAELQRLACELREKHNCTGEQGELES